jgi:hypothetical protein
LTRDNRYLLWIQNEKQALTPEDSDRVANIVEINTFEQALFIPDLINWTKFNVLQHNQTTGDSEEAFQIWNEDGLLIDFEFNLDLSKQSVLDDMTFKLVAFNSVENKLFELDSFELPLNSIFSGGIQQIEIDETRGYLLKDGNEFNFVKLTTGAKIGDLQYYQGQIGQKIRWQDWLENLGVDSVFYDKTKPQNNLNFKSSNYSGLQDYEIKIMAESNLSGVDQLAREGVGFDQNFSNDLPVYDYGVSNDGGVVSGQILLLDPDTLESTEGVILRNKNTLFQVVWNVTDTNLTDAFAIHRIQASRSIGDDKEELSSLLDNLENQILKSSVGTGLLDLKVSGSDIISECLIDNEKLQEGVQYDLSGTIKKILGFGSFIFTIDTNNAGSANDTIILPLTIAANAIIDWGDTNNDPAIVGNNTHIYAAPGIYQISISGDDIAIRFNNTGDKSKLISVQSWGIAHWVNGMLNGCNNCTTLPETGAPKVIEADIGNIFTSMSSLSGYTADWSDYPFPSMTSIFGLASITSGFNPIIPALTFTGGADARFAFQLANDFNRELDFTGIINPGFMFNGASGYDQSFANFDFTQVILLNDFVRNAGLSSANYNTLLAKLRADAEGAGITNGMTLGANSLVATGQGVTDRTWLINNTAMTIIDATP